MRDIRQLNIWKEGLIIIKHVYRVSELLPDAVKYGLNARFVALRFQSLQT